MKVIIETTTGTKEISGQHLDVKSAAGAIRIIKGGQQIAAFREWQNWQILDDEEKSNS